MLMSVEAQLWLPGTDAMSSGHHASRDRIRRPRSLHANEPVCTWMMRTQSYSEAHDQYHADRSGCKAANDGEAGA